MNDNENKTTLSEEKTTITDGDLISRQAVLELMADYDLSMGQVVKCIHTLPSVISQPSTEKTAEWVNNNCSICGKGIEDLISSNEWYRNEEPKFCPFCGAKIEIGWNRMKRNGWKKVRKKNNENLY